MFPIVLDAFFGHTFPGMSDHRESLAQVNLHYSILFFAIEYEHFELGSILGLERTNDTCIEWLQNASRFRRQKQDKDIVQLYFLCEDALSIRNHR